nr:hypothetical protein Iba_chr08fCG0480 [Ipomoea batatas]
MEAYLKISLSGSDSEDVTSSAASGSYVYGKGNTTPPVQNLTHFEYEESSNVPSKEGTRIPANHVGHCMVGVQV